MSSFTACRADRAAGHRSDILRTEGAERALSGITGGLGWEQAAETVVVSGKPSKTDVDACWNLGATVAASLMS